MGRRIGCLGALLVVGMLLFAGCSALTKGDVPVPDVVGKTRDTAEILVEQEGLRLGSIKYDEDARVAHGTIISQRPNAGDTTVSNGKVHVVIAGPDLVRAPALEGKDEQVALSMLEDADLRRGRITRVNDDRVREGRVVSAEPAGVNWLPRHTKVHLVISQGPDSAPVPGVQGMWDEDAQAFIYDLGFDPEIRREYGRYTAGLVMDQWPPAGTDSEFGNPIDIIVSKGAPPIDVPDVRGLTVAEAEAAIRAADLVALEERVSINDFSWAEPIVGKQYPHAGSDVPAGSGVTLVVWEE